MYMFILTPEMDEEQDQLMTPFYGYSHYPGKITEARITNKIFTLKDQLKSNVS